MCESVQKALLRRRKNAFIPPVLKTKNRHDAKVVFTSGPVIITSVPPSTTFFASWQLSVYSVFLSKCTMSDHKCQGSTQVHQLLSSVDVKVRWAYIRNHYHHPHKQKITILVTLPGHGSISQPRCSSGGSGQDIPDPSGGGLSQVRLRVDVPEPHSTSQSPHWDHRLHSPSTVEL